MVITEVNGEEAVCDLSKKDETEKEVKKQVHVYCDSMNQLRWVFNPRS